MRVAACLIRKGSSGLLEDAAAAAAIGLGDLGLALVEVVLLTTVALVIVNVGADRCDRGGKDWVGRPMSAAHKAHRDQAQVLLVAVVDDGGGLCRGAVLEVVIGCVVVGVMLLLAGVALLQLGRRLWECRAGEAKCAVVLWYRERGRSDHVTGYQVSDPQKGNESGHRDARPHFV